MKTKMPTLKELKNRINPQGFDSVKYGESRAILNHLDEPVLAYAIGMGGFMAVYQIANGYMRATGYSCKFAFTDNPDGGFFNLSVKETLGKIATQQLCEKKIDRKKINNTIKTKGYDKKLLGHVSIKGKQSTWGYTYEIREQKNGKIKVNKRYFREGDSKEGYKWSTTTQCFFEEYRKAITGEKDKYSGDTIEIIENSVPDEEFKRIKKIMIAQTINEE